MEINLATSNWLSFPAFPLLCLLGSTAVSFSVSRFDCAWVYHDVGEGKYTNVFTVHVYCTVPTFRGSVVFRFVRRKVFKFLISNFPPVLNVVCFLLGNSPASEVYMPTFRNTLFHFYMQVGVKWTRFEKNCEKFPSTVRMFPSWLCLVAVIKNLHETYQCRMYSRKRLMMGREDARNMYSFITE